jgi:hypothetical protein
MNPVSMDSSSSTFLSGDQEQQQPPLPLPPSQNAAATGSKKRKTTEGNATEGDESDNGEENHVNIDNAEISSNNIIDNSNNINKNNGPPSGSGGIVNKTSVTIPVSTLHQHLICSLCRGYFRDPYTISDCLHTFCRSCLVMYFRKGSIDICCPTW